MTKANYLVFKSHHNPQKLGFYQPCQRYVDLPITDFTGFYLGNVCLNGFFIMVQNDSGTTLVVDIARGSTFSVPPPDDIRKVYFVESGGKILRVAKQIDGGSESSDSSHSNFCFEIYQLDPIDDTNGGGYRWVKSCSIGDQVLFLDWHGGISVAARENSGLRGNSIYFLQMCYDGTVPFIPEFELHWYNIADGHSEKIPSRFNIQSKWFVPRANGASLPVDP